MCKESNLFWKVFWISYIWFLSYFLLFVILIIYWLCFPVSWCCDLYIFEHLVNYIVSVFQVTSELCLTNQSYSKNMSVLFKSMTATLICFLHLLISTFNSTNYISSSFFVLSALKTSNDLSIISILILSSLTNYLIILT